jgi:hypothetical protein
LLFGFLGALDEARDKKEYNNLGSDGSGNNTLARGIHLEALTKPL